MTWPDGHRGVLKWRPHSQKRDLLRGPLAVCEAARRAGVPAPVTELVEQVGHAVAMVQELLPGTAIERLDPGTLGPALRINEQLDGLLRDRPDIPAVELYLRDDGPGYCLHGPLRRFSPRAAALERRIRAVEENSEQRNDAVHLDFHPGNLLAADNEITGLVDWDGAGRGDRRLDLVTLRFGIHGTGTHDAATREALDAVLDRIPAADLKPLWAHMSLRMADWAIRHHPDHTVHHWLDLAEQRL
ncbi:phosphotransferase [Kineosporia succinea]|nr:phosphotransferase [Kineosporia succinea]